MAVSIGARTQVQAHQGGFGAALAPSVSKEQAAQTLKSLSGYIRDAQGNLRNGDIRIVNTTNANELSFKFKSFGWGQQYRKDRTAEALVTLLNNAGVPNALGRVDALLKPKGQAAYGKLTAAALNQLLSSPEVRAKILTPRQHVESELKDLGYRQFRSLGKPGSQGMAQLATLGGQEKVVKLFMQDGALHEQKLDGKRQRDARGDYFASYLATAKRPNPQALVLAPEAYVVKRQPGEGYETLTPQEVRQRGKAARAGQAEPMACVGLVMKKAPGEILSSVGTFRPGDASSVGLAKSGLQTLRALNERGLMHRDIKPDNMSYDPKTGNAYLFDTGFMYKTHKPAPAAQNFASSLMAKAKAAWNGEAVGEAGLPDAGLGTTGYVHPRVAQGLPYGTQADLHSFAMTLLEKSYSGLSPTALANRQRDDHQEGDPKFLAGHQLMDRLTELSKPDSRATLEARADAQKFLDDVKKANSYAHLIQSMLMKAETDAGKGGIAPAQWADREVSNRHLDELLNHPALNA